MLTPLEIQIVKDSVDNIRFFINDKWDAPIGYRGRLWPAAAVALSRGQAFMEAGPDDDFEDEGLMVASDTNDGGDDYYDSIWAGAYRDVRLALEYEAHAGASEYVNDCIDDPDEVRRRIEAL